MAKVSADRHARAIVTVGPIAFYPLIIRAFPPALLHSGHYSLETKLRVKSESCWIFSPGPHPLKAVF